MSFSVLYSKTATKEISKFDNLVKRKIKKDIETKLLEDPTNSSTKLRDFKIKNTRRFRVSNYRIIFIINKKIIEVLRVGHRREIYK